jgi:hypothetical protein
MTAIVPSAPMRRFTAYVGVLLIMGLTPPGSWLGLASPANQSAYEAFGMSLALVSIVVILGRRHAAAAQPAAAVATANSAANATNATPVNAAVAAARPAARRRESAGGRPKLDGAPIR